MSRKANPAIVGGFIVVAVAIAIGAAAMLASGVLFSSYTPFVTYFSEPVNGLSVGAPVKFRGIQLGEVSRIGLHQSQGNNAYAEIRYDLEHRRLENLGGSQDMVSSNRVEELVKEGLRARLEVESVVTGVVFITLEFKDDAGPPVLVNPGADVVEIPSTLSPLSELTESAGEVIARLSTIDVIQIYENILTLTGLVNQRLDEFRLDSLAQNLTATSERVREIVTDPELETVAAEMNQTFQDLRETNRLVRDRLMRFDPAINKIDSVAMRMNEIALTMSEVSENANAMLQSDAEFRRSLESALTETASTMKSLRRLIDMLERNPNVIIAGKPKDRK